MSADLRTLGGVGANPPRASFLGVRSLSLVFADFATLLVFVFVFIFVLCSFFVPRCNHRWLWEDQDSCQGCEMTELLHKQLPLCRLDVQLRVFSKSCMDRSRRDEGEKSEFTLRLLWFTFGAAQASVLHTHWLCVRTGHWHLFVRKRRATQTRAMRL